MQHGPSATIPDRSRLLVKILNSSSESMYIVEGQIQRPASTFLKGRCSQQAKKLHESTGAGGSAGSVDDTCIADIG